MNNKKKILWGIVLGIVPLIYTFILYFTGSLKSMENNLIDFRYRNFNPNHKFSNEIVLVDIDETALIYGANIDLFGRWPWKRNVYKPILEFIALGSPKLILFDIMFTEQSREDYALAEASESVPIISHAMTFRIEKDVDSEIVDMPGLEKFSIPATVDESCNYVYKELSIPAGKIGSSSKFLHSVSYDSDNDGVARRGLMFFPYRGKVYPSLGLQAYNAINPIENLDIKCGSFEIKTKAGETIDVPLDGKTFRYHYYPNSEIMGATRVSISGIIDSQRAIEAGEVDDMSKLKVNPEIFTDKVIIIGTSAAATHDTKMTPYGSLPGVFLHSITASNLLQKHFLHFIPDWISLVVVFLATIIGSLLMVYYSNPMTRIVVPVSIITLYLGFTFVIFKYFNMSFNLAVFSISTPISFFGAFAFLTFIEGAEKRKYSKVLANMVDPTIVGEALNDLETLKKGGEKEITAFFSDVASFSTISEALTSTDLAALLNEYLSAMTIILKHNRGTLDKYIGDAIVGIFGAPIDMKEHYLDACKASLEMFIKLEELKKMWVANNSYSKDAQIMNFRIGLNTGKAKVGFMGTDTLASYTMMGDTVNLAARLEAAGKDYGVNIMIAEATKKRVENEMFTRKMDAIVVKGKTEPVNVYELISLKGTAPQNIADSVGLYEEGFDLHLKREFDKAIKKFQECSKVKGKKDKCAYMLIERCEDYILHPPADDWNGSFVRTHK